VAASPARVMHSEPPEKRDFEPHLAGERSWLRRQARKIIGNRLRADVDGSDLTQDTLLAAERARHGKLFASRGAFRAWLRAILRNSAAQRGRRPDLARAGADFAEAPSRASSPSMTLSRQEGAADVLRHLKSLSERDREVVLLRVVEDLSFSAIGARLGVTEVHARVLFNRAARSLRDRGPAQDGR
jgi:RNA polymerase sigma-70 factor, ECF subfamily